MIITVHVSSFLRFLPPDQYVLQTIHSSAKFYISPYLLLKFKLFLHFIYKTLNNMLQALAW